MGVCYQCTVNLLLHPTLKKYIEALLTPSVPDVCYVAQLAQTPPSTEGLRGLCYWLGWYNVI